MPEPSTNRLSLDRPVAPDIIGSPLTCVRCDYDLRGLPADGRCPECGLPVEVSLRERRRLADAAAPYVNMLYCGAWLVVIALALAVLAILESFFGALMLTWVLPTAAPRAWDAVFLGLIVSGAMAWTLGWWWLAAPNPDWSAGLPIDHDRRLVRVTSIIVGATTAVVFFGSAAMRIAVAAGTGGFRTAGPVLFLVITLAAFIAGLVHFFAAMNYMQRLAWRADDPALAHSARQLMWAGPLLCTAGLCILIGPLIALALYWSVVERLRAHLSAIRSLRESEFSQ